MSQPNRFQKLVADAKQRITEISAEEAHEQVLRGEAVLLDVREEAEFRQGHAQGAQHLSKGVIEVEIEDLVPDPNQVIIAYCGGGSRSALVADNLQKMGYSNVRSLAGGMRAWNETVLPTE
ncbi:MAG TPA: rhodanese-like domain-containing protein [Chthoniobacterales bacterium]|nr:rhodanese-like domain-containing protein [Chthoniobacterales bacterium]